MGRGKRIKVSWQEQPLRREGGMEIGEREDDRVGEKEEKKRETGFGKEGEEEGHCAAYSMKQEGTICLQFCCVISKKGSRY